MDQYVPKWRVCSAGYESAHGARYTLRVESAVLLDYQTTGDGRDFFTGNFTLTRKNNYRVDIILVISVTIF